MDTQSMKLREPVAAIFISMMERMVNITESLVISSEKLDKLCLPDDVINSGTEPEIPENEWPEMFQTLRSMYNIIASNIDIVKRTIDNAQV